jgi:hypothetical protein
MPKIAKDKVSQVETMDGFEGRYEDLGGYTVGWEAHEGDADFAPIFVGLPDDRCQSRHWGVVLEGELTFHYADGTTDVVGAGEAYYAPPGHTPSVKAGTRIVEFSPSDELGQTMEVVLKNVAAMA